MTPPKIPLPERLARLSVRSDDGCLVWIGARDSKGYGAIKVAGRMHGVHRIAYEVAVGPIPEGMTIDHLCGKPPCIEPEHLEPVSIGENIRRARAQVTHCPQGHPYDEENTYVSRTATGTRRHCRECGRQRVRARRKG